MPVNYATLYRNVRRSIYEIVRGLFGSPPAGSFSQAFNVYNEEQMRDPSVAKNRPLVFVTDALLEPTAAELPAVIVEVLDFQKTSLQLGDPAARVFGVDLNVFGNGRGVRDDLSSFLQEYFPTTFNVLDYASAGSPVVGIAQSLSDSVDIVPIRASEDVGVDGSLSNFDVVSSDFMLLLS